MTSAADRVQAILESPSYRLAEDDTAFMESAAARASRLSLEFMRADMYLREHRINSTVVVFGGTRIKDPDLAKAALDAVEATAPADTARLAQARRDLRMSRYYTEARQFAHSVSRR